jgi:hypothetical protein
MSRGLFANQNQDGESYSFTTNKNGTFYWYIDKHNPDQFPWVGGSATPTRNIRIDFGDGSPPEAPLLTSIAGLDNTLLSQSHVYTDGSNKTVTFSTEKLEEIRYFRIGMANTVNNVFTGKTNLDLTPFKKLYFIGVGRNVNITGFTFDPDNTQPLGFLFSQNCDLTGEIDLTGFDMTNLNTIDLGQNPNLTSVKFPSNTKITGNNFIDICDLSGHYDLSSWGGVGQTLKWNNNNLTGITLPLITGATGSATSGVQLHNNDLTGVLDLSPLTEAGNTYQINSNTNLTNIIFPTNTRNISKFEVHICDLRHLDVSTISGLTTTSTSSSTFRISNNTSLSAVTTTDGLNTIHTDFKTNWHIYDTNLPRFNVSGSTFDNGTIFRWELNPSLTELLFPTHPINFDVDSLSGYDCPLLTDIDISAFNVGDQTPTNTTPILDLRGCTSLSGLTLPSVVKSGQTHFSVHDCNLSGSLDLSNYTGLMKFDVSQNSGLTSLTLPTTISTQTLTDASMFGFSSQKTFQLNQCDLGYVDFKPMSGVTLNSSSTIYLQDNGMAAGEVNNVLVDFVTTTWDDVTLDISGTNSAPDSSSGGYDGVAALSTLTGGTRNWIVTTS